MVQFSKGEGVGHEGRVKIYNAEIVIMESLLDSMVASFILNFPRGVVWYCFNIEIGIGIDIGSNDGIVGVVVYGPVCLE